VVHALAVHQRRAQLGEAAGVGHRGRDRARVVQLQARDQVAAVDHAALGHLRGARPALGPPLAGCAGPRRGGRRGRRSGEREGGPRRAWKVMTPAAGVSSGISIFMTCAQAAAR
jgi:hypothetical protein